MPGHEKLNIINKKGGAQGRNRTTDTRIFSPVSYLPEAAHLAPVARIAL